MKIIVIDNFDWSDVEHRVGISGNVPYLYIPTLSNYVDGVMTPRTFDDVVGDIEILGDLSDVIYLINIHCIFSNGNSKRKTTWYLQEQHGMTIYRQLLKVYEKKESELRVAFFSPIPKDDLIKLKTENYVLKYHECFLVPFNWDECARTLLSKNDWKVFNNASENLLAGFGMYRAEGGASREIGTVNKKILFIDDQSEEWETTFVEIFKDKALVFLPYATQSAFRMALSDGEVLEKVDSILNIDHNKSIKCNIVLSDLYLEENHEPGMWMNREHIEGISGFKLYKEIRTTDKGKGVPFIVHTSSNKVSYYKFFDQQGVDEWIVKDTRPNTSATEKRDSYIQFKNTIESICKQNRYQKLQYIWERIQTIKKTETQKWWYTPQFSEELLVPIINDESIGKVYFCPVSDGKSGYSDHTKEAVISILESSWYAIRRHINKESYYEGSTSNNRNAKESDKFLATSICNNLGKILEMLGVKSGAKDFSFLTNFLLQVRNAASHSGDYEYFDLNDAFICFEYLTHALLNYDTLKAFQGAYPDKFIASRINSTAKQMEYTFPCSLLWLYLQFHNEECSKECVHGRAALRTRIMKLHAMIKGSGIVEEVAIKTQKSATLNWWFNRIFRCEMGVTSTEVKNTDPLKISIPIIL